ncbi:DNA polymerase IV [Saccharomonospora xinjiangensis]|uniref:DNA polymerase IV n=1 Tax=Saccharomonospora xinjiangensis XJ-54 TaxID=882086 RepID=I0UZY0_9PSEU|nr:DNA polymerase IV [Saccharomonospora xinjiangensis]EID53433.1 nucleotidyltransferase/DNA polymerase involved in DNA repair [Saccharomonospora xinjiangensis XJ-54]
MSTPDWVLHVDLDQFIAAVEIARHPELRGKPVVVGGAGDPSLRGVVATASYEAREFGVHSGMPLRTAARRCPDAIFVASDPPAYEEVSERVMAVLREFPVVVEVAGWDEAFLGVSGEQARDPERLANAVREAVSRRTGLSCAVGIGDNKHTAKLATGFAKPGGIYRLTRQNWTDVMGGLPTDALWGIGSKTRNKLAAAGITTVSDLAGADPTELAAEFGPTLGPYFRALAHGLGDRDVTATPYVSKSRSREITFQHDISDAERLREHLARLAERVAGDVAEEGRPVARVAVKVRFAPFVTRTRSVTLASPTNDAAVLAQAAADVFGRFTVDRPVRLLGVRAEFVRE